MWRFVGRWPALVVGLVCLAAAVGLAESSDDTRGVVVFLGAVGAVLIGLGIGTGPKNGSGSPPRE